MPTHFNNLRGRAGTSRERRGGFLSGALGVQRQGGLGAPQQFGAANALGPGLGTAAEFQERQSKFTNIASRNFGIQRALDFPVGQELEFFGQQTGRRLGALGSAADELDPRNDPAAVERFGRLARGRVGARGRAASNRFRGRFGSNRILQSAFDLNASNQAEVLTGQFQQQISDPSNRANRFLGVAGALGPGNVFGGLNQQLTIAGQQRPAPPPTPTLFDKAVGALGVAGGAGLDLSKIFKF